MFPATVNWVNMEPSALGCRSENLYKEKNMTKLVVLGCSTSPPALVVVATALSWLLSLLLLRLSWLLLLLLWCCLLVVPSILSRRRWRRKNYSRREYEVGVGRCWCTSCSGSRPAQSRNNAVYSFILLCIQKAEILILKPVKPYYVKNKTAMFWQFTVFNLSRLRSDFLNEMLFS